MIDTTLPNIADRWQELYLPILKDKKAIKDISSRIEQTLQSKWKAQEELIKLRAEFGAITT